MSKKKLDLIEDQKKILKNLEHSIGKKIPLLEEYESSRMAFYKYVKIGAIIVNKRVIALGLQGCNLEKLPDSIGNLESLESLNLSINKLIELPENNSL